MLEMCLRMGPYQQAFTAGQIAIRSGQVSDAIAREARVSGATLVVMGSRGRDVVTKLLLGSTSDAVLRNTTTPVLLVPPSDIDIVSGGDRVALTCGPVMAAVDLEEVGGEHLAMASRIAHLARQPLSLMTVARSRVSDQNAAAVLRERSHGLAPVKPRSLIVRRGPIAAEISRCARVEGAGLVVMGLRPGLRSQPGAIASAVLKTKRAFVLALPASRPAVVATPRTSRVALRR